MKPEMTRENHGDISSALRTKIFPASGTPEGDQLRTAELKRPADLSPDPYQTYQKESLLRKIWKKFARILRKDKALARSAQRKARKKTRNSSRARPRTTTSNGQSRKNNDQ
jgi:hypothetical protein